MLGATISGFVLQTGGGSNYAGVAYYAGSAMCGGAVILLWGKCTAYDSLPSPVLVKLTVPPLQLASRMRRESSRGYRRRSLITDSTTYHSTSLHYLLYHLPYRLPASREVLKRGLDLELTFRLERVILSV